MKAKIRVATDMYEFIELEVDAPIDEIWSSYKELKKYTAPNQGLDAKEYNAALDRYLKDGTGNTETYVAMNPEQQRVFQEIKKSLKRIKAHEGTLKV